MWAWVGVALLIALAAFTVSRLYRSWRIARTKLESADPPRSGPE
jgi:hypothetical protein